jgi:hypothetical protein
MRITLFKLPYRTGTFLTASILISIALMYAGVVAPTIPERIAGMWDSQTSLLFAWRDLIMACAHIGLIYCGIRILFRKVQCIPTALFLVSLVWTLNIVGQLALGEWGLLIPTTGFALFAGLPLLWTLKVSKRRSFILERRRRAKSWLHFAETVVAMMILGMALSVAVMYPLGQMLGPVDAQQAAPLESDRGIPIETTHLPPPDRL